MEYNSYVQKVIKYKYYLQERAQEYSNIFPGFFYKENPSEEECLEDVKANGRLLVFVKNQTEEICLAAVEQSKYALQYVERQTEKLCLAAVRQDAGALLYINQQTLAICLEAVRNNPEAIDFVKPEFKEACEHGGVNTVIIDNSMIGIEQYKDSKNIRFVAFTNAHVAIGARAFENCRDLKTIFFEGNCELIAAQHSVIADL